MWNDPAEEKALDLLIQNYQNLHSSFWECHKIYWTLTSIFVPVSLTFITLILKYVPEQGRFVPVAGLAVTLVLATFWFMCSRYLDACNRTRRERLREIEDYLNRGTLAGRPKGDSSEMRFFAQYTLHYGGGFRFLTIGLYLAIIATALVVMHVALSMGG